MSLFYKTIGDRRRAFTLIELLIVIGIVAIISTVTVITLNPAELLRQARDSNRFSDYDTLNRAFNLLNLDTTQVFGVASTTYISIPDPAATSTAGTDCSGVAGLPSLPPSWSYHCAASSTYRNVNGTGWMPVNFGLISSGAPFGTLPVDPVNNAKSGFFYAYVAGNERYVFTVPLDSKRYLTDVKLALRDQGTDQTRLESGTNLLLWARATGLSGYWPFDEGGGTNARDFSGNDNQGTLMNGPTWTTGKVGSALSFNGINQYVSLGSGRFDSLNNATIAMWFKYSGTFSDNSVLFNHYKDGNNRQPMFVSFPGGGYGNKLVYENISIGPMAVSASFISTGVYYFVAYTCGTSGIQLYLNGTLEYNNTSYTGCLNAFSSSIDSISENFNGIIDDARIYSRALSAPEVRALYNATQ